MALRISFAVGWGFGAAYRVDGSSEPTVRAALAAAARRRKARPTQTTLAHGSQLGRGDPGELSPSVFARELR